MNKIIAEYLWVDGATPTQKLRSKTKVLDKPVQHITDLPEWGFDGSSTGQATGDKSDCILKPIYYVKDPLRGGEHLIVMCEVMKADGSVHPSNTRAYLREIVGMYHKQDAWFGIEQEYTFFDGAKPLGWPDHGFPAPQGGYYCGVGADEVFGREIVEAHMQACLKVGLSLSGINAEVMPGQWEYQIGPLGPLEVSDQIWISRWLLYRIAEKYGVSATLYPKPVKGDWNGAGAHTNFSTRAMREDGGIVLIREACEKLGKKHKEHMAVYGAHNEERMTGHHETCSMHDFKYGVSDRGASVRIPLHTDKEGKGYFEDRRPAANMDPYQVCAAIMKTVCEE
jgi:glutamine synthetase